MYSSKVYFCAYVMSIIAISISIFFCWNMLVEKNEMHGVKCTAVHNVHCRLKYWVRYILQFTLITITKKKAPEAVTSMFTKKYTAISWRHIIKVSAVQAKFVYISSEKLQYILHVNKGVGVPGVFSLPITWQDESMFVFLRSWD